MTCTGCAHQLSGSGFKSPLGVLCLDCLTLSLRGKVNHHGLAILAALGFLLALGYAWEH